MSEQDQQLEGVPAIIYAAFWQTREMGFLKKLLMHFKVTTLRIVIFFEDYQPGALIRLDGTEGDFRIEPITSLDSVEHDGAIIGKLGPVIKSLEKHLIWRNFKNMITGKVKLKGKLKLYKFAKILMRCAI